MAIHVCGFFIWGTRLPKYLKTSYKKHLMKSYEAINSALATYDCIQELVIRVDMFTGKSELQLLVVEKPFSSSGVRVLFKDVADVKCNLVFAGGYPHVGLLGIRAIRDGFERPLVVEQIEYDDFSFRCVSAELLE